MYLGIELLWGILPRQFNWTLGICNIENIRYDMSDFECRIEGKIQLRLLCFTFSSSIGPDFTIQERVVNFKKRILTWRPRFESRSSQEFFSLKINNIGPTRWLF